MLFVGIALKDAVPLLSHRGGNISFEVGPNVWT